MFFQILGAFTFGGSCFFFRLGLNSGLTKLDVVYYVEVLDLALAYWGWHVLLQVDHLEMGFINRIEVKFNVHVE